MSAPDLQVIVNDLTDIMRRHTQKDGEGWGGATKVIETGLDSFDVVELVFQVEEKYGITVTFNANTNLSQDMTIEDLSKLIQQQITTSRGAVA